jgi:hypothetical protein
MRLINHYPGGEPISRRPKFDTDVVVGVMSVAFLCAGVLLIWGS